MEDPNVPGSAPAAPAAGQAPGQGDGAPAGGPAPTREALLAELPEGLRAALSHAPDDALVVAHRDFKDSGMLRSDYDRKRGTETSELRQLREELLHTQGQIQGMSAAGQTPTPPPPSEDELMKTLLESTDPGEYQQALDAVVGAKAQTLVDQALQNHPVLARARLADAASRARPETIPEDTYGAGYNRLMHDLEASGLDPMKVDPSVVSFLAPVWAEREALLSAAKSANGAPSAPGTGTPAEPARTPGAPAVPPVVPPVQGGVSRATAPAPGDPGAAFGPGSTLADRVKATLAQMGMTTQDLGSLSRGV